MRGEGCGTVFELITKPLHFSAFSAKLEIELPLNAAGDFLLASPFTLGPSSDGIHPPAEPVTLRIGTFATTIPPGSFKGSGVGPFTFQGVTGGVALNARIAPTGTKQYSLQAEGRNANLTGTANPVPVTLTIGNDSGAVSVNARIVR
jgi:hypothetical protein